MDMTRSNGPWPTIDFSLIPLLHRLFPLMVAAVLIFLVLFALQTYHKSSQVLARQHNLQHLRLVGTVTASLENRLKNMQAAYNHYATLIVPPFGPDSGATRVCDEIEKSFSTIVSSALIIEAEKRQDLWTEKRSRLALTPDSVSELEQAASKLNPNLLLLRSIRGEGLLIFLTPLRLASAHLGVVVPLERMLATYHINDTGDGDYIWILGRDGTLLYHPDHPEMVGNNIYADNGNARDVIDRSNWKRKCWAGE